MLLAYAILKVAYTCPKVDLVGQQCTWVKPSEVDSLTESKDAKVIAKLAAAKAFLLQVGRDLAVVAGDSLGGIWATVSAEYAPIRQR